MGVVHLRRVDVVLLILWSRELAAVRRSDHTGELGSPNSPRLGFGVSPGRYRAARLPASISGVRVTVGFRLVIDLERLDNLLVGGHRCVFGFVDVG